MPVTRRHFLATGAAATVAPQAGFAQGSAEAELRALWSIAAGYGEDYLIGIGYFLDRGTIDSVPGLILAMRYSQHPPDVLNGVLAQLTGETGPQDWFDWMLWQERNPQVIANTAYGPFKRALYLRIDQDFAVFLQPQFLQRDTMRIRLEEVTWGGVVKDGIPSLDTPTMIAADQVDYLQDDDLVFGVAINGDIRAYPLRIMGWHEMFNDIIGGVPVALAYCTLCGAGILFETGADADDRFIFGSSGFLYRSNKLMFDRQTHSLWNQFTGEPVMGPLALSGIALPRRPVVIERWGDWRAANPGTSVLSVDTGFLRDYGAGVVYGDYFASPDLMFPAVVDETLHRQKDYVFGIQTMGAAKAWPLEVFSGGRVLNDAIADTPLVLIGDDRGRSVRAYERGDNMFQAADAGRLISDAGTWQISEEALVGPAGEHLARVPGHVSYWFAWNGYLGDVAELYAD